MGEIAGVAYLTLPDGIGLCRIVVPELPVPVQVFAGFEAGNV